MITLLGHKGLKYIQGEDDESTIYYNDEMLKSNILICESTYMSPEDKVDTCITVLHINDIDAGQWEMYFGDYLQPIQIYRAVLDIYEMYRDFPLNLFLQMADEMSVSSMSSSMQSKKENKESVMVRIKSEFERVKNQMK